MISTASNLASGVFGTSLRGFVIGGNGLGGDTEIGQADHTRNHRRRPILARKPRTLGRRERGSVLDYAVIGEIEMLRRACEAERLAGFSRAVRRTDPCRGGEGAAAPSILGCM
jgi:hypothetical protein